MENGKWFCESEELAPEARQYDGENFCQGFFKDGLNSPTPPEIEITVRIGKPATNENRIKKPRPLKVILKWKASKGEVFRGLRHLRDAPNSTNASASRMTTQLKRVKQSNR